MIEVYTEYNNISTNERKNQLWSTKENVYKRER